MYIINKCRLKKQSFAARIRRMCYVLILPKKQVKDTYLPYIYV